jgi:transposase
VAQGPRQRRPERPRPGAPVGTTSAQAKENAKLKARAERAERELAKTKAALEIGGKAHALLEMLSESADTEPRSKP